MMVVSTSRSSAAAASTVEMEVSVCTGAGGGSQPTHCCQLMLDIGKAWRGSGVFSRTGLRRVGLAARESGVLVWACWLVAGACELAGVGMMMLLSESLSSDGSGAFLRRGRDGVGVRER